MNRTEQHVYCRSHTRLCGQRPFYCGTWPIVRSTASGHLFKHLQHLVAEFRSDTAFFKHELYPAMYYGGRPSSHRPKLQ
jgi:hypothetical protein